MEIEKIKHELIKIYKNYLTNPEDKENNNLASIYYNKYKDLYPILKPEIATAINTLVDIGFNTGIRKSPNAIKEILKKLEDEKS
ncbi:MAG: hypothetical protein PHT94_03600 [Candidatus Nanoarchaeia archaeon]|nr:hypothetical protein [Candidatus Nanoarchaeia archaeon]